MLRWFRKILQAIRRWWSGRDDVFKAVVLLDSASDPKAALHGRQLVLIGSLEKPKWLKFACPCRCGEILALNLMASHTPRWSVEQHADGTLTVFPSVDATTCGSHFWIRHSRIEWV